MNSRRFHEVPFWELAFRPFFLLAAAFSLLNLSLWVLLMTGHSSWIPTNGLTPIAWHMHEMIFGFGGTVAAGFLLTAVQTWTGLRSLHGCWLITLTLIWLLARSSFWLSSPTGLFMLLCLQGLWWLGIIWSFSRLVIKSQNDRNKIFILLLSILMILNLGFIIADGLEHTALALHIARTCILLFGILVCIIGGRVIPMFTRNATRSQKIKGSARYDQALLICAALATLTFFAQYFGAPSQLSAALLILTGLLHAYRLFHWDTRATLQTPLLWSLHLSYLLLALGLVMLGLSEYWPALRFADALHLIAVGTIGGMILPMMARVALAHTGRPLSPPRLLGGAFALILLAAIARFLLPYLATPALAWQISALLWFLAFLCFIVQYIPILFKARIDA